MIKTFAGLLRCMTRSEDILCRYGGDEFVVILKHLGDVETVKKKGSKICRVFRESLLEVGIDGSCSCGVAISDDRGRSMIEWIELADRALYNAKRQSKGSCCLWNDGQL